MNPTVVIQWSASIGDFTSTSSALFAWVPAPWIVGFAHPGTEFAHIASLLGVGAIAMVLGARSRWGLPLLAMLLLCVGFGLGTQGATPATPFTIGSTTAIALVLMILGKVRPAFAVVSCLVGSFAFFHAVADGAQIRELVLDPTFFLGYVLANAMWISAGAAAGVLTLRHLHATMVQMRRVIERLQGLTLGH